MVWALWYLCFRKKPIPYTAKTAHERLHDGLAYESLIASDMATAQQNRHHNNEEYDHVLIGNSIGTLFAAALLSQAGRRCCVVYESSDANDLLWEVKPNGHESSNRSASSTSSSSSSSSSLPSLTSCPTVDLSVGRAFLCSNLLDCATIRRRVGDREAHKVLRLQAVHGAGDGDGDEGAASPASIVRSAHGLLHLKFNATMSASSSSSSSSEPVECTIPLRVGKVCMS